MSSNGTLPCNQSPLLLVAMWQLYEALSCISSDRFNRKHMKTLALKLPLIDGPERSSMLQQSQGFRSWMTTAPTPALLLPPIITVICLQARFRHYQTLWISNLSDPQAPGGGALTCETPKTVATVANKNLNCNIFTAVNMCAADLICLLEPAGGNKY